METNVDSLVNNEANNGFKSLQNVESFEDFDMSKMNLVKGETPKDIQQKCLQLCQNYLSGEWCQQTVNSIQVKRISGGLTNQLYHCAISKPNYSSKVPQEVVIRLYGIKYSYISSNEENERLSDVVIGTLVSNNKIGPHLYGLFDGGQIQKYYKHRQYLVPDQRNANIVKTVFQLLAKIHSMNLPIKRNVESLHKFMRKLYKEAYEKFAIEQDLEKYNCKTLKEENFLKELEWVWDHIRRIKRPIVFSHNDFRSSNILITEPNDEVVICDFEYSTYTYIALDLVQMMSEWGRYQWDLKAICDLPLEDSVFGPLVEIYTEECERIHGKEWSQNPINSVQHILSETKVFLLNECLQGILFFYKNDDNDPSGFPVSRKIGMGLAEKSFKDYFIIKQKLIEKKIVNE